MIAIGGPYMRSDGRHQLWSFGQSRHYQRWWQPKQHGRGRWLIMMKEDFFDLHCFVLVIFFLFVFCSVNYFTMQSCIFSFIVCWNSLVGNSSLLWIIQWACWGFLLCYILLEPHSLVLLIPFHFLWLSHWGQCLPKLWGSSDWLFCFPRNCINDLNFFCYQLCL